MSETPKIRILWIDDRERVSGFPERTLPDSLAEFFEVVHPASSNSDVMSYSSASDFMHEFKSFWFQGENDFLPAEIIATDYNLKKKAAAASGKNKPIRPARISDAGDETSVNLPAVSEASDNNSRREGVDFDGLLIGAFYSALTYLHPSALVSITNYFGDMPSEVNTLRELISPFLSIATQEEKQAPDNTAWLNLVAVDRSWKNIVMAALPPLRNRIKELYKQGHIVIPPGDLINIINGEDIKALRVLSKHGVRDIPVKGLFWNNAEDSTIWAESLLTSIITKDQYLNSEKLAKEIWSYYNNDILLEQQARLSQLHVEGDQLLSDEYIQLKIQFGLAENSRGRNNESLECTKFFSEIRKNSCNKKEKNERRWAALFLIRWLFKRILVFIDNTNIESVTRQGEKDNSSLFPTIEADDIFLLLFPVPTSPFPLPWHLKDTKLRNNKMQGWENWMTNNLGFHPNDVLNGSVVTVGERQILQGITMAEDFELHPDNPEIRLEKWKKFEPARLFLFGPDGA